MNTNEEDEAFDELFCQYIIKALGEHLIVPPYIDETSTSYRVVWTVKYRRGHFNKNRCVKAQSKLEALKKAYISVFSRSFEC